MENQQPRADEDEKGTGQSGGAPGDEKAYGAAVSVGADEFVNIRVMGQDSGETWFKLRRTTPLQKLFDSYCERKGLNPTQVRFLFDGSRVKGTDTPKSLDIETDDMIDAVIAQVGG